MNLCRQILSAPNMDILRYGDVYSMMVEYYTTQGDHKTAIQLVNELVARTQQKDNLLFYIDKGEYNFIFHSFKLRHSFFIYCSCLINIMNKISVIHNIFKIIFYYY